MEFAGSSSAESGRNLPIVDCPDCFVPVLKHKSKKGNTYYKCPKRCGNWWFEDAYERYLRERHIRLVVDASGHSSRALPSPVGQLSMANPGNPVTGVLDESELDVSAADVKLLIADLKVELGGLQEEARQVKQVLDRVEKLIVDNIAVGFAFMVVIALALVGIFYKM